MQKKPHAKVAKAAKTQAANVVRSPVLRSLFGGLFFSAILILNLCVLGGLCVRRLGFDC